MVTATRRWNVRSPQRAQRIAASTTASLVAVLIFAGCTSSGHSSKSSNHGGRVASHTDQSPTSAPSGADAVRKQICGGIDSAALKFTSVLVVAAKSHRLTAPRPSSCSAKLTSGAVFATYGKAKLPAVTVSVLAKPYGRDCGLSTLGVKPSPVHLGGGINGVLASPPRSNGLWICWSRGPSQVVLLAVDVPKLPVATFQAQALQFARSVAAQI